MDNDKREPQEIREAPKEEELKGGFWKRASLALWILKNRRNMFISLIVFLLLVSIVLYSHFFYNLYDYIRYSPEERRALREIALIGEGVNPTRLAIPLEQGIPESFFHNNRYDFVNKVENPNSNFLVSFRYCFLDGEEVLACDSGRLFPEEEKYLVILSKELDSRPINLDFRIENLSWQRIDFREYPDWPSYYAERMNFIFSDIEFESTRPGALSSSGVNRLFFNIKNNGPYNYWEIPLTIVLFDQRGIVGLNRYTVLELMSLKDRDINLSWSNSVGSVDRVEIQVDLNILNENNYIRYR
jgi:hypothetical protein